MRYPEFIERVMANVDFESRDQAELVIKESLAALGERSYRTEQDKLAAQLPKDLREYLSSRAEAETMRGDTDRYSLEAFYNRVSARTDVGFPEVIERSSYLTIFTASGSLVGSLRSLQRMLRQGFDRLNQKLSTASKPRTAAKTWFRYAPSSLHFDKLSAALNQRFGCHSKSVR